MRKIGLFLGIRAHAGGGFQYAQAMLIAISALPRNKFHPMVVYTSDEWLPYLKELSIEKHYVHESQLITQTSLWWHRLELPVKFWRKYISLINPLHRRLKSFKCDHWVFCAQERWTYQIPLSTIGVIHDLMHRYEKGFPEVAAAGRSRRRDKHYKQMCRWANCILVDSEIGKMHVIESYKPETRKIEILAFTVPKYMYKKEKPVNFDSRYSLPKKYFFFPAQFWEHKNHKGLIEAIKILHAGGTEAHLVLVGSKKNGYTSTMNHIRNLKLESFITNLGYVPDEDMPELYRRSRALIFPSFFGPTNIPPIEALIVGCPVATSGIYGMKAQLGDAALFFDPKSPSNIAATMKKIWWDDKLCRDLIEKGEKRSIQFTQDLFNHRLEEILSNIY